MADLPTVVVGGGLAGIAAALALADAGRQVVLIEARPRLGGAAFSFRRGELSIDNGQHVFLRCCDAYRGLLARLGVAHRVVLQPRLDIPVLRGDGRSARLSRLRGVPAPAHLTAALVGYGLLSPADRMRAVRGALALRRLDPADDRLDAQTLGAFLRSHGQNDATIGALWGIVATATLNLPPAEASLALAAKVFRTGLLDSAPAADLGYANAPLGDLHSDAALAALEAVGVQVLLSHRARAVEPAVRAARAPAVVRTTSRDGDRSWQTDGVVLALPWRETLAVAEELKQTPVASAAGLGAAPIVNVHVVYDRQVTDLTFAAAVDSPAHWIFDRTSTSGLSHGQYLAVTVSAADAIIDAPSGELTRSFTAELARLLPGARRAQVVDAFVTRERRATFRQRAGTARLRPASRCGVEGVWLAGSWTATGWPDTMESAVRSGVAAAAGLISDSTDRGRVLAA